MKKTNVEGIFGFTRLESAIKAADAVLEGCSVYNADTGLIIVPDTVDGVEHEAQYGDSDSGTETTNGNWLYGVMTCRMDAEEVIRVKEEYGYDSLTELALESFPATGTAAEDRMGSVSIESKEDLLDTMADIFTDEPGDWYAEHV